MDISLSKSQYSAVNEIMFKVYLTITFLFLLSAKIINIVSFSQHCSSEKLNSNYANHEGDQPRQNGIYHLFL